VAKRSSTMGDFAEDLGRILGSAQNKATAWLDQRTAIAGQLTEIRDTANRYLQQLGSEGAELAGRFQKGRRGRPPGAKSKTTRKVRRMSAAARKRISDAQKARWAKVKAGKRKS
jgi:hypothetical protein